MSLYEYIIAEKIHAKRYPFFSLIMAAMMHGGYGDGYRLKDQWPHIHAEMRSRMNHEEPYRVLDKNQTSIDVKQWEKR